MEVRTIIRGYFRFITLRVSHLGNILINPVVFGIAFVVCILNPWSTQAQWPPLSTPNVQVTSSVTTGGKLKDYWSCPDGNGGSYNVFSDDRQNPGGNESIYGQRINRRGAVMFAANGVALGAIAGADQDKPKCTDDGLGNAIACWHDNRAGNDDIYAQKIDSLGVVQWTVNGVVICNAPNDQGDTWIVSDGSGGAIIAWDDNRSGNKDIYAQRINSSGIVQWTANGVVICNAANDQKKVHMVADGAGGAIIVWEDRRTGVDVYAQRINSAGVVQWTANGVVISNAANDQKDAKVTFDGNQGGIIAWTDKRTGTEDIYAQLINSAGVVQWAANGVAVCTAVDKQKKPEISSDNSNGAVIVWEDKRSGTEDIYAQRLDNTGTAQWLANGKAVCTAVDVQKKPFISMGNGGNTLIVWEDARTGGVEDIYIQVLDILGVDQVALNGLAVCTATDKQSKPFIYKNGTTDWIVIWKDDRNVASGQTDLYAQGLNPTIIPVLPIELLSFTANLDGDRIALKWVTASETNNDFYTVEKSRDTSHFTEVLQVDGAGNSNAILEYYDFDNNPWEGVSYYRLKQTDFDGNISYSGLVPVEYLVNGTPGLSIFPDPAYAGQDVYMLLKNLKGKEVVVVLRDIKGAEIYSKVRIIESESDVSAIDPAHKLPAGTYLVIASSNNLLYSRKLIVR